MMGGLGDIWKVPELRKRIFFTIAMLAVYRLGVFVSTPGINIGRLRAMFEAQSGTLLGIINMFSGGALENFSIFTLGIAPYISVSIIIQILTPAVPALEALKKDGDAGRRILTRYTRLFTIALAVIQSFMIALGLERQGLAITPGWTFRISTILTLTTGTAFIMWLGEQITEKGIGNGISTIIFAGIVARMPAVLANTIALARTGEINPISIIGILFFSIATVFSIVYIERSFRRIPIQYPRRMVGKKLAQAQTQYLPLKFNMSGVIPPIFASAFLVLPATFASFSPGGFLEEAMTYLQHGTLSYTIIFSVLIIVFCYFYTAIVFNPEEVAENLKKNGGSIPTVRPGKPTVDYLYGILNRLALWGSLYICLICLLPEFVYLEMGALDFSSVFGGTAVLIAVGVTLDTASQIESMVVARHYESFMSKSSKMRGGVGSMSHLRARLLKR
jgi:preprotein translocase subunit SecY